MERRGNWASIKTSFVNNSFHSHLSSFSFSLQFWQNMFPSVPFSSFHLFSRVKCSQKGKRKRKLESCIQFPSFSSCSCMESNVKLIKRERERTFSRFKTSLSSLLSFSLPLLLHSLLHPSLSLSLSRKLQFGPLERIRNQITRVFGSPVVVILTMITQPTCSFLHLLSLSLSFSLTPSPLSNKLLSLPTLSFTFLPFIGFIHLYSSHCLLLYGVNLLMCHSIHSFSLSFISWHLSNVISSHFFTLFSLSRRGLFSSFLVPH